MIGMDLRPSLHAVLGKCDRTPFIVADLPKSRDALDGDTTKHVGKIGKQNGIYNNYKIPFGKSIRVNRTAL